MTGDLCPGYKLFHTGDEGSRCCCGLHWSGVMPPHTEEGHQAPLEMILKRMNRKSELAVYREKTRRALVHLGAGRPLLFRLRRS